VTRRGGATRCGKLRPANQFNQVGNSPKQNLNLKNKQTVTP